MRLSAIFNRAASAGIAPSASAMPGKVSEEKLREIIGDIYDRLKQSTESFEQAVALQEIADLMPEEEEPEVPEEKHAEAFMLEEALPEENPEEEFILKPATFEGLRDWDI